MTVLDELVGEYLAFRKKGKIVEFGSRKLVSDGIAIPASIRKEAEQRIQQALFDAKQLPGNPQDGQDYFPRHQALQETVRYCQQLQEQYASVPDRYFLMLLGIPGELLAAAKGGMEEKGIEEKQQVSVFVREESREIIREPVRKTVRAVLLFVPPFPEFFNSHLRLAHEYLHSSNGWRQRLEGITSNVKKTFLKTKREKEYAQALEGHLREIGTMPPLSAIRKDFPLVEHAYHRALSAIEACYR